MKDTKRKEYAKKYYEENKEKLKKYSKTYRTNNIENIKKKEIENKTKNKKRMSKYYQKNKEKILKQNKKYQKDNPDICAKACRRWYNKNKHPITQEQREYNREYHRDRREIDKQYNIKSRLRCCLNMAIKRYTEEDRIIVSKNKNIDYKSIIEHLKPFPENLKDYQIDHIIPLNFFDLTDSKQVKKAWNPINFQWLRGEDNNSKRTKIDFEKYPEQEEVWSKLMLDNYILSI